MDQNFNCLVEIDGQRYDIIIKEDFSSICFEDIYQKLKQIIKLALNQDIDINTHVFEVFDHNCSKGHVIQSFGQFVKHLSTIRINRKQVISPSVIYNPFDPNLSYQFPQQTPQTVAVQPIVTIVPQKPEEDFVPHEYYCDRCPELAAKQSYDPRLKEIKLNLNFESYKRFSDLLQTVKTMSDYKWDSITEYEWLNVLPFKMRAFGYKNFSPKLWKNSFDLFLKKYIEVMDASPNRSIACSLFPFFHEYNSFEFDIRRDPNIYKQITYLRQRMNIERIESSSESSSKSSSKYSSKSKKSSPKDEKRLRKLKSKLLTEEEDIHAFYRMVKLIEPGVDYTRKTTKKWSKISYKMIDKYGYSSRRYSPNSCRDRFYDWALFYAKNFYEINGNIDSKLQKIFDLLKIVHILDLSSLYGRNNENRWRLKRIAKNSDIKDYLKQLDYEEYEERRRRRSRSCLQTNPMESQEERPVIFTNQTFLRVVHKEPALRDPRLNRKSSVTTQSGQSTAISVDKLISSAIGNPTDKPKEPSVVPSVTTVSTVCEPTLKSYAITNQTEAVENRPLPLNSNNESTNEQINGLFPTIQSNVSRDPRLNRKRNNDSEEVVTQTIDKTTNSVKKVKSEPIEIIEII